MQVAEERISPELPSSSHPSWVSVLLSNTIGSDPAQFSSSTQTAVEQEAENHTENIFNGVSTYN